MQKTLQYLLLTIVIVALLFPAFLVQNSSIRFLLILAISLIYFFFGIFHHYEEKNLSKKIVFEYMGVSLIVFVVLFSLLIGKA
jgi:hypothetical protein